MSVGRQRLQPAASAPQRVPGGAPRGACRGATLLPLLVGLLILLVPERWSLGALVAQGGRAGQAGIALLCARVAGLSPRQRIMCRSNPDAMVAIGSGLRLGLLECQHQFRHERWNCSSSSGGSSSGGSRSISSSHGHGLPLVVRVASREAAFSLAVQAAAISWSAATACARGELAGCSCAKRSPHLLAAPPPPPAEPAAAAAFRWGGCSSDVEFGARLSRTFLDAAHSAPGPPGSPPRLLMDRHNSKAGRKAVKMTLQTDCKCHGVSGSCSVRTCWTTLAPFRRVGDHLMSRYRAASPAVALPVFPGGAGGAQSQGRARRHPLQLAVLAVAVRGPRTSRHAPRLPRRSDLVFLQGSPNYCDLDAAAGSLGTAGRACNRTSRGADGCDVMCCGRGFNTRQVTSSKQCRCKFHWCCYVHCDICTERYEEYTCK